MGRCQQLVSALGLISGEPEPNRHEDCGKETTHKVCDKYICEDCYSKRKYHVVIEYNNLPG